MGMVKEIPTSIHLRGRLPIPLPGRRRCLLLLRIPGLRAAVLTLVS